MADFTIYRGDTIVLNIAVTAGGVVYSLVGCNMWFTAKWAFKDLDVAAVFQKTIGSGIVLTSPANGLATITILPADTAILPNSKVLLLYDCQVKDASGKIYTVSYGNLIFLPDVTLAI